MRNILQPGVELAFPGEAEPQVDTPQFKNTL